MYIRRFSTTRFANGMDIYIQYSTYGTSPQATPLVLGEIDRGDSQILITR